MPPPAALVFCPAADDAVSSVATRFGLSPEHAEGAVALAKSLKVDDPGIFISFRPGPEIRTNLQRAGAGFPCHAGGNGDQALANLKQWVTDQVPDGKREFVFSTGSLGMGIGNLTQDEFTALQNTLSFTSPIPLPAWVAAMATGGFSLGGLLAVTGTGIGQATMSKSPSIVFSD